MESVNYENMHLNYDKDLKEMQLKNDICCVLNDYIDFLKMKQSLKKHPFDKYKLQKEIDELKSFQNKYCVSNCLNNINSCQKSEVKDDGILSKSSITAMINIERKPLSIAAMTAYLIIEIIVDGCLLIILFKVSDISNF